jgi:hypothetical protein
MLSWTKVAGVAAAAMVPALVFSGTAQAATIAGLWHMEAVPQMADSSGHGNNGTATAVTAVSGSSGTAYHFNGRNSVVTVPDSSSLDPGTAALRVTAHVRFTVVPSRTVGDYDLIRKGLSGTSGGDWKMEIFPPTPGGSVAPAYCLFQDATGRTASIRGTTNLADGAWHTIVCAKTSTGISLTVDGATRSSSAKLGSIGNSKQLALGAKPGGGDQYLGDLDEVSIQIG